MKKMSVLGSAAVIIIGLSSGVYAKNTYNIAKIMDSGNIIEQERYLGSTNYSSLVVLGGQDSVNKSVEEILSGKGKKLFFVNKGYIKNNKKYVEGYFDKFVTDLDEARKYEKETGRSVIWNDGDGTGDYIPDDGFDLPISNTVTLEVDDNAKISEIDFDSKGNILNVDKDFNNIIIGKYKDWPIFGITLKDGVVTEMHQEYRP